MKFAYPHLTHTTGLDEFAVSIATSLSLREHSTPHSRLPEKAMPIT
jgi:hypothetical protein